MVLALPGASEPARHDFPRRCPHGDYTGRSTPERGHIMGDKSPKSKDKNKKQTDTQKKDVKTAHALKQAPPAAAVPGKKK